MKGRYEVVIRISKIVIAHHSAPMVKKTFQTACLLVTLSVLMVSVAYAFVYATQTHNVTQTVKKTWYNSGWQYRKNITIQGSQIPDSNTHSFDATGGYINIGNVNWGSTTGTISFWIKWDVVSNRPWGQHDNMEMRISGSNLALDWGATGSLTSTTSFVDGGWYFIAIVWNENTNRLYIYVGDETNSPSLDAQNTAWYSAVSTAGVTQNNFMNSRGASYQINGRGDELRYWNVDRSLAQIQGDYSAELAGSETNLRSYYKLNNSFDDIGPNNDDASGSGSYAFNTNVPSVFGDAELNNFPVMISITDTDLASDAQDDGDDILFTLSDKKTKLSHEIERFSGATGELLVWVKVPSLFRNNNTLIYMYYGNSTVSSQQDAANVWDSNYVGVWHLKENPAGTAPQMQDSTSNNNDGTSAGTMTSGDQITGKIDGSLDLDGSDDEIRCGNAASLQITAALTVEAWAKTTSTAIVRGIVNKEVTTYDGYQLRKHSDNKYRFAVNNVSATYAESNVAYTDSNWHYIVGVKSTTNYLYVDGAQQTDTFTQSITESGANLEIGSSYSDYSGYHWSGQIDEVRISNIARSDIWIQTQYNNQNAPASFHSLDLEETH